MIHRRQQNEIGYHPISLNTFYILVVAFILIENNKLTNGQYTTCDVPLELSNTENATYIIGGLFPVHYLNKERKYEYNSPGLMWIESMIFAIDEINNRSDLLPNSKLGYRIFDSCNTIGIAIEAALQLVNGQSSNQNNQTCSCKPNAEKKIIGLVGDAASVTTTKVASLLAASKTPQISYSATTTDLSEKHLYPSFMRTIPPDNFQARLVTDLMLTYGWKYINVVACDDSYGRVGVDELLPQLKLHGICVAVYEIFDVLNDNDGTSIKRVIRKLKEETKATVIVLWCQRPEALRVLRAAQDDQLYHRTWIATETYGATNKVYEIDHRVVAGMFGIIPAQVTYKPFTESLKHITPNISNSNPWLEEYWVNEKKCIKSPGTIPKYICPDQTTDLTKLPTNKYVNVIDAVYAIVHALHNYVENNEANPTEIPLFNDYVKNVTFTGKSNTTVSFNEQGNPTEAMYTITNVQYNPKSKSFHHERIGNWNDATRKISFATPYNVQFANLKNDTPLSSCAEICNPGHYGLRFGDKPCCWKCVTCPEGEIQPEIGQHKCIRCENDKMPNSKHTMCIEPKIVYLNVAETTGSVVLAFMLVGYLLILSCVVIFYIKRGTPIVKASNKGLSILQILSMLFQLALPILYFQKRITTELCGAALFYFILFNTITISVTFTKADRLLGVFRASKSGVLSKNSKIKGNGLQYFKVCLLTIVGIAICTIMFAVFAPESKQVVNYDGDYINVLNYCGGYYDSILFSMVAYIVMISLVCSVYAFKARKLPHDYNEARFTSFAMFTFILIWIMAVPIYFSRENKVDKIASWCVLCFLSTLAIFIPMYTPKIYVILFKPEENTVERFRENLKQTVMTTAAASSTPSKKSEAAVRYVAPSTEHSSVSIQEFASVVSEDK